MKALCISNSKQTSPHVIKIPVPEEVTIIDEAKHNGREYWQFAEYPYVVVRGIVAKQFYDKTDFAILPDQSAEEMQQEKHEAIIYQR